MVRPHAGRTALGTQAGAPSLLADGAKLDNLPYVLRGKLAGGLFGGLRFTDKGTLSLPGAGKTGE